MKVAYTTHFPADNLHSWSGLIYFIREALRDAGCEIQTVDSLREAGKISGKLQEMAYKRLLGTTFLRYRRPSTLDAYPRQVEAAILGTEVDVVFSPSSFPIARLKPGVPTVFWSDACFAGLIDFYPTPPTFANERCAKDSSPNKMPWTDVHSPSTPRNGLLER